MKLERGQIAGLLLLLALLALLFLVRYWAVLTRMGPDATEAGR